MVAVTAGLSPADTHLVGTDAEFSLDDHSVTDLWRDLFDDDHIRDAFIRAVRRFAADRTLPELYDALQDRGVPYWLHSWIRDVALGNKTAALRLAGRLTPGLADTATVEQLVATATLFDTLDGETTVAIQAGAPFRERRRDQREDVLRLVATLAQGMDVRLVSGRLTRRWLAHEHRSDLPDVRSWCSDHRDSTPTIQARVDDALDALTPDDRETLLLRRVADDPSEALSYSALYAQATVGKPRVRQVLGRLEDLGLVATYGAQADRHVELLEAGREYLAAIDRDVGRQQSLTEATSAGVSDPPKSDKRPCSPAQAREGGEDGPLEPFVDGQLSRAAQDAAAGAAEPGAVTLDSAPLTAREDAERRTRFHQYDAERRTAFIAVRATGPLSYRVSAALALLGGRIRDHALPDEPLREVVDEPAEILRGARCIGALDDSALDDPDELRSGLLEWGETIEELTRKLRRGDYEDRDRFRGEIVRSAAGLQGTMIHLLDVLGIDIIREVRVSSGLNASDLEGLAEGLAHSCRVESRWRSFAAFRQLFEGRTSKREQAFSPTVDAADPYGDLVGSIVVRGGGVERLRPLLENALGGSSDEIHEDAPEFAVPVDLREVDRGDYVATMNAVLDRKRLRSTPEAVSLLRGLAASPHDAVRALEQLGEESFTRALRPDEVRYALSTLPADRLVPSLPPTVGKVLAALLRAEAPVSQRELADRADVSTQAIRDNRGALEALDLVRVTEDGWRLALSFRSRAERRDPVTPSTLENAGLLDVLDDVLETLLPTDEYSDPSDPVGGVLFWPPDPWGLRDDSKPEGWLMLAAALADEDPPVEDRSSSVEFGPEIEQAALVESSSGAVAT